MIRKTLPLAFVSLIGLGATAVHADQPSYNIDDVTACSSDAMRLCRDRLPDLEAIESCMKSNYDRLKPACKARFAHQR